MIFSKRSKDALLGVEPALVAVMQEAIKNAPHDFTIIEGVRTATTQKKYFSYGRTVVNPNTGPQKGKPFGAIITGRDGVKRKSEHQVKADGFGHAVDFCPYSKAGGLEWNNTKAFKAIAAHIKTVAAKMGVAIVWGGDWITLIDLPHIELK